MSLSRRQFIQKSALLGLPLLTIKHNALASALQKTGLKSSFVNDFLIGSIMSTSKALIADKAHRKLLAKEFNSLTMENAMKWAAIHPHARKWNWKPADNFVKFGLENNMKLVGHVLVWHSQMDNTIFKDKQGNTISKPALMRRLKKHIDKLVGRYKGKIWAWDVVNEAIDEGKGWRKTPMYEIIGEEYMDLAFHLAHIADPQAQLLYNDYNMHLPAKRDFLVNWVEGAKERGVPIHAIGLQGHLGLDFPDLKQFEESIIAYARTGMRVHITELDVDILPVAWEYQGAEISKSFAYSNQLNPWPEALPQEIEDQLTARYVEIFKLFLKHRDKIDRVTLWGTSDAESWKNNFPVKGRTNYPLLFDRQNKPKPAYFAIQDPNLKTMNK